jgi:hypothetical protein
METLSAMVKHFADTFDEDPAYAIGTLVPDIALVLIPGGAAFKTGRVAGTAKPLEHMPGVRPGGVGSIGNLRRFSQIEIDDYVARATQNPTSHTVTLGRFEEGSGSYQRVAQREGDTYFNLSDRDWDSALNSVGGNYEEMWRINRQFLDEQIARGKEFRLTHDPNGDYSLSSFYYQELQYLRDSGYKIILEGDYWYARK